METRQSSNACRREEQNVAGSGAIGVGLCADNTSVTPSMFWAVAYE